MQNDTTGSRLHAIERAYAKSAEQEAQGNKPILLKHYTNRDGEGVSTWSVPSRTTNGAHYILHASVDADGCRTMCECPAGQVNRPCWHRAHVRRALLDGLPFIDGSRPVARGTDERADLLDEQAAD